MQELLGSPRVLLLDEPTSGLDSTYALLVVRKLCEYAQAHEVGMLCTLHQPSSQIVQLIGRVILMAPGGVTVFSGSPLELERHLDALGMGVGAQGAAARDRDPDGRSGDGEVDASPALWGLECSAAASTLAGDSACVTHLSSSSSSSLSSSSSSLSSSAASAVVAGGGEAAADSGGRAVAVLAAAADFDRDMYRRAMDLREEESKTDTRSQSVRRSRLQEPQGQSDGGGSGGGGGGGGGADEAFVADVTPSPVEIRVGVHFAEVGICVLLFTKQCSKARNRASKQASKRFVVYQSAKYPWPFRLR